MGRAAPTPRAFAAVNEEGVLLKRTLSVLVLLLVVGGGASARSAGGQAPARDLPTTARGFDFDRTRPNAPSEPEMWIPFHLERKLFETADSVVVSMRIYNPLKQVVAIPVLREPASTASPRLLEHVFRQPGRKSAFWDGRDLAGAVVGTGIYYAELTAGARRATLKLVVVGPGRTRSLLPWK